MNEHQARHARKTAIAGLWSRLGPTRLDTSCPARSRTGILLLCLLAGVVLNARSAAREDAAARVVIVANENDRDSLAIAEAYAEARSIPRDNIIALPMSRDEAVDWTVFVEEIFNPLQAWLVERGWIDAIPMDLFDDVGRRRMAVSGHRISHLVLCRGVPLRLLATPGLPPDLPRDAPDQLRTARAAIDSELTLLARSGTRREGFLPNPLFARERPGTIESNAVVRVARLDGPTASLVHTMIARTLDAERQGLIGRAYVDLGGPHVLGDKWLEAAADILRQAGWSPDVDRARASLHPASRADAAALYLGWYDSRISGPFAATDYRFPAGAIALHIHSESAASLRNAQDGGWCGPLVARGVSATFGNVHEPYLEYTHRPDILMRALLRGATLGEAAYEAMPVLGWQSIVIGDPLYRPFEVSFASLLARWRDLPETQAGYVVLREVARFETAGFETAALELLQDAMREAPSLAVGLQFSARLEAAGELNEARRVLRFVPRLTRVPVAGQPLLAEAARRLGATPEALDVWDNLLALPIVSEARQVWLAEAVAAAEAAGEPAGARLKRWRAELEARAPAARDGEGAKVGEQPAGD